MAITVLAVQDIVRAGLEPSFTAANTDGHSVVNSSGSVAIYAKNASAGSIDVTIATPNTVDGLAIADRVVAVPAGEERMIGPFSTNHYGTSLAVTFSAVASLTVAALKF